MNIQLAARMAAFNSSIFSEISAHKERLTQLGKSIIDLSIGSPDLPPALFVKEEIAAASMLDTKYGYALHGSATFCEAVRFYYRKNHRVNLGEHNEIVQLMGSQDGLVHLPMILANPGDYILVPDPGYTAYATGIAMAGARPFHYPLKKESGFLPDFDSIPADIADKSVLMILNSPGNPIPTMFPEAVFRKAIDFANKHNILIVHDFAYSEFFYGDKRPISFLSVPGSKEVGIEVNSLSKSHSMAGCRIAYAAGNEQIIAALRQLKSNLDYGVFHPIQQAGTKALLYGDHYCEQTRSIYRQRRDILVHGLKEIGWPVQAPEAGMFLWTEIPIDMPSADFVKEMLDKTGVAMVPGRAFGPSGEGFVRIALVQNEATIMKAIERIKSSQFLTLSSLTS
ncbi:MAG: LL-diaminopimelate aminotransferase [Bacillus sp. (in: firmicutes)]